MFIYWLMSEEIAVLDLGHTNIEDDLTMAIVKNKHGKQDFMKTLDNYIDALQKSVSLLTLLKESVDDDEVNDIELVSNGNTLSIQGDPQLIERFVAFGIANYDGSENDDSENEESENEDYSDSD
jgi:hypothetical protein